MSLVWYFTLMNCRKLSSQSCHSPEHRSAGADISVEIYRCRDGCLCICGLLSAPLGWTCPWLFSLVTHRDTNAKKSTSLAILTDSPPRRTATPRYASLSRASEASKCPRSIQSHRPPPRRMKVRGSTGADMIRLFKLRGASRPCEDLRAERVLADNEEVEYRDSAATPQRPPRDLCAHLPQPIHG